MLKNKIVYIFLICSLLLPVCAEEQENINPVTPEQEQLDSTQSQAESAEQNYEENAAVEEAPQTLITSGSFKQPVSKKKIAKKFLLAMLGVLASSLFIYFALSLYNKIRFGSAISTGFIQKEKSCLESPETLSEAVKSFINKTKWE